MQARISRQRAITAASPPAISVSVPFTAASAVLPTGQSIIEAPFAAMAAPTLRVALGDNGIVEGIGKGAIYIDMSTIDPGTTRKVGALSLIHISEPTRQAEISYAVF